MTLATKIAVLNDGELQQVGTHAEIYNSQSNLFVADLQAPDVLQVFVDPDYPNAWIAGLGKKLLDHLHGMGLHLIILVGDERYFIQAEGKPLPDLKG
jgi:multiple sugar transport system ATP-binding protein